MMKRKVKMGLIAMVIIISMSGCKKENNEVADDFADVSETETTNMNASTENSETADAYVADDSANLPVDAMICYGDKKTANIYYDLQEWPSGIGGPISAIPKELNETYVEQFVNKLFDGGQYVNATQGTSAGIDLSGDLLQIKGKIDGIDMVFSVNNTAAQGGAIVPFRMCLNRENYVFPIAYDKEAFVCNEANVYEPVFTYDEPNIYDKDAALKKAEEYLKSWGFDNYSCVGYDEIALFRSDEADPKSKLDGYKFVFRKQIENSLGAPYEFNCFYHPDNVCPSFFEQIVIDIASDGLVSVDICDMYDIGTDKKTATVMDKDAIIERGTAAITDYLQNNPDSESNILISTCEEKKVWRVFVDLAYVPIAHGDDVSYQAMYIFSIKHNGLALRWPVVAIDSYDGDVYNVESAYCIDNANE